MMHPILVPIGGFLGAGKTSLILAASRFLQARGSRPAAILNDQGNDLVDTAHVTLGGVPAAEVTGGCFCCRFSELAEQTERLIAASPDVIFIEPVGSCTDLAATVVRPLLSEAGSRYRVAPLTVLVDPGQLSVLGSSSSMRFLFDKQIAEADVVVFNKSDLYPNPPHLPGHSPRSLSAKTGFGIEAWLDEVLAGELTPGIKPLEIDYALYAQAEADLGWLNWSGLIELDRPVSPAELIGPWLDNLQSALSSRKAAIAHLKFLDHTGSSFLKAALTSGQTEPAVEGDLTAPASRLHDVRINLRALIGPHELKALFDGELLAVPGRKSITTFQCFSPLPPKPERRLPW